MMKHKTLIFLLVAFFLIVNTSYFWEGLFGFFAMPVFLLLVVSYIVLIVVFFRMLFLLVKEKFRDRQRLIVTISLLSVLLLTFFKPFGIINFDKLSGKDLLVAEIEGTANCATTLKLKEDHVFIGKSYCFGVTEVKGSYQLKGDTIFFNNSSRQYDYYTHAVVKQVDSLNVLVLYKGKTDPEGYKLYILKNELMDSSQ